MRLSSKPVRAVLLVWMALLYVNGGLSRQSTATRRILVLHWDNKDHPANIDFDRYFEASLQSYGIRVVEYYPEYLESNRFPGEDQSLAFRDYLRRKYADLPIDIVVANSLPPLQFLLSNRDALFGGVPILFMATDRPAHGELAAGAGATGVVFVNAHARTVDMALRLHPGTKHLFVISGTLGRNASFTTVARNELRRYERRLEVTYLTDLPLLELTARLKTLPDKSIVLYVWQLGQDPEGRVLESKAFLARVAPYSTAPIYGMSSANIGSGLVGGYVWTIEGNTAKLAGMTKQVLDGARPADIAVEDAPEIPMFDWRQLQRWRISESLLPPASEIRFREHTFWQQYQWQIVGVAGVFLLQAILIGMLLGERRRARRIRNELEHHKSHLEQVIQSRTAELVVARDEAVAANRSKSMFLANMSHELRTPLSAILGFSDMVLQDPALPDRHRRDLAIVGSSGEHLLGLIDDILDMAKIETGRDVVETLAIDVCSLTSETVNMLRERATAKGLELSLEISPDAPRFVRSDPRKIRQVLVNLIGNALKYTDVGSVAVTLNDSPQCVPDRAVLAFDVEDTGIGIAEKDQTRIFDPFIQVGRMKAGKGVGLGLAISRHFVELLGGTIQVVSSPGHGSQFHVEIPVEKADTSEVSTENAANEQVIDLEPGQPGYRVLVVEDEKENRLLLERLLQTAGFDVRVAEDGAQAVEVFGSWHPHFIWMDLRLPVLSGPEAACRIRQLQGGREVKIVAVTASAFASQREEVLESGFDDFLRKPYRSSEVFDCMARHLRVRYVYRAAPATTAMDPPTLCTADLEALPIALLDRLESAIISLDRDRIRKAVGEIANENAALGRLLAHLVDRLAFTPILDAIEKDKPMFRRAGV